MKNLTFLVIAGLLANACIFTTGDTDTDSNSSTSNASNTSTAGTDSAGTSTGSSGGTGGSVTGSSGEPVTTTFPTSDGETATSSSSEGSTGGSAFGNCGWNADLKYYGCDGEPGVVDPDGISPIECPAMLPMMGDKCDETTPVNNVGCCLPDGSNYYCNSDGMIQIDACG